MDSFSFCVITDIQAQFATKCRQNKVNLEVKMSTAVSKVNWPHVSQSQQVKQYGMNSKHSEAYAH